MKPSEQLYNKYSWMARRYASRVFNHQEISLEYEDLVQEFSLKIWTSIRAYGQRWLYYRNTGCNQPIPLKHYLESSCKRLVVDLAHGITGQIDAFGHRTSVESTQFDYGYEDSHTEITLEDFELMVGGKFVVEDVDLLQGLQGVEANVYGAYLCGYTTKEIAKVYSLGKQGFNDGAVNEVIHRQTSYLRTNFATELLTNRTRYASSKRIDNE